MIKTAPPNAVLSERLLYLDCDTLRVPYNPADPLVYTIIADNRIAHAGAEYPLRPAQVLTLNHLRLAVGHPVPHDELYATMNGEKSSISSKICRGLNDKSKYALNTILRAGYEDQAPPKLIVTDLTLPHTLIRPVQSMVFVDKREPARPQDDNFIKRYAHYVMPLWTPEQPLPAREGHALTTSKSHGHQARLQRVGAAALIAGDLKLVDAYSFSLRYGEADFLRNTLLPAPGGKRLAYNHLFPRGREMPPADFDFISAVLQRNGGTIKVNSAHTADLLRAYDKSF